MSVTPNIGLQRTARLRLAAAEAGSLGAELCVNRGVHMVLDRSLRLFLVASALLVSARLGLADSLVVAGTGSPGSWTTQIEMANPTSTNLRVTIYEAAGFQECTFPVCPFVTVTIPPNGTATLPTSALSFDSDTELQTVYITSEDGVTLPTVRAQAIDPAQPGRRNVLSVIRLSTLNALSPSVLVFPGAARTSVSHSNLAIGAVSSDGTNPLFTIRVEVFSSSGSLMSSGEFSNMVVPELGFGSNVFLGDVLGRLGIADLADGQIRVTRLAGDGTLWGELAVVHDDGGVEVSQGVNP